MLETRASAPLAQQLRTGRHRLLAHPRREQHIPQQPSVPSLVQLLHDHQRADGVGGEGRKHVVCRRAGRGGGHGWKVGGRAR